MELAGSTKEDGNESRTWTFHVSRPHTGLGPSHLGWLVAQRKTKKRQYNVSKGLFQGNEGETLMTETEFNRALKIAGNLTKDPGTADTRLFNNYGHPRFEPVSCTIEQVAALIRWQAWELTGGPWDAAQVDQIRRVSAGKFRITP